MERYGTLEVYAFVECRTLGHAWEQIPSTKRPPFGEYIWTRCVRCTMERHDIVNRFNGRLESRHYYQPEGYKAEYIERAEYRKMYLKQITKQARKKAKEA
ncbi:MAG TPA: hypothetical protein VH593_25260 [Ktedonobacteraceae bacterium]